MVMVSWGFVVSEAVGSVRAFRIGHLIVHGFGIHRYVKEGREIVLLVGGGGRGGQVLERLTFFSAHDACGFATYGFTYSVLREVFVAFVPSLRTSFYLFSRVSLASPNVVVSPSLHFGVSQTALALPAK